MHHRTLPLLGIAIILSAAPPAEAQRGPLTRRIQQWFQPRPQQQGYNTNVYPGWRGNPITRPGLNYLNQLGGGLDSQGYYRTPFSSQDAFGTRLNPGTWEFPMEWEQEGRSILLNIDEQGRIYRQDYRLVR